MFQSYREQGFMIINLMGEDAEGGEMDVDELNDWAETYGLTFPVVSDPGMGTMWAMGGNGGLPWQVLVGRGGEILAADNFVEADAVESALAD